MAITFNRVSVPVGSTGASPVTFTITSSTGNLLIAVVVVNTGVTVSGVTDSKSQTWVSVGVHGTATGGNCYIFYKASSVTGVTSINVTLSSTGVCVAVFDCGSSTGGALGSGYNALSSQTTSNPAPSLVASGAGICVAIVATDNNTNETAASPFTDASMSYSGIANYDDCGYDVNSSGGTLTCHFTGSTTSWSSVIAEFVEATSFAADDDSWRPSAPRLIEPVVTVF